MSGYFLIIIIVVVDIFSNLSYLCIKRLMLNFIVEQRSFFTYSHKYIHFQVWPCSDSNEWNSKTFIMNKKGKLGTQ